MRRRDFLTQAAVGAAAATIPAAPRAAHAAQPRKPNLVYILADDLGYGDLGCYGQKQVRTPNLDRLAAEGIRFTDHYSGSTVCAPSRATLMTGFHTGHLKTAGQGQHFGPDETTVAEILKRAGYATGLVGKWGLGQEGEPGIPTKKGFDYFFGYLNQTHAHNYYPDWLWRNEEKVRLRNVVPPLDKGGLGGVATERVEYSHDLLTQEALRYVEQHRNEPFLLYLAYTLPHANNEAGKAGMEVPDYGIYKDRDWPEPEKGRAAMVSRLDRDVGTLLEKLKSLGIAGNTLVMFASDNGPHREGGSDPDFLDCNGPLRGIKRDLYEGGIRVPMVAWWPGKVKPGSATAHPSAFWDVLPTLCEAAGVGPPKGIDGLSFLPTLLGRPGQQKQHDYLYWECPEQGGKRAVRMGKWKAVQLNVAKDPTAPIELYDLEADLGEQHNVAAEHPDVVARIKGILDGLRRSPDPG
jgi:arylsulfatase A-like enzyme